jgi:hypothetical protein
MAVFSLVLGHSDYALCETWNYSVVLLKSGGGWKRPPEKAVCVTWVCNGRSLLL